MAEFQHGDIEGRQGGKDIAGIGREAHVSDADGGVAEAIKARCDDQPESVAHDANDGDIANT